MSPPKWYNIHISKSFEGAAGALAAHPSPTCQHRAVFVSVSCGSSHLEAAQVSAVNNRARGGRETGFSPFGNVLYFYSVSSRMPDYSVFPEIYCGRCCSGLARDGEDPGGPGTAWLVRQRLGWPGLPGAAERRPQPRVGALALLKTSTASGLASSGKLSLALKPTAVYTPGKRWVKMLELPLACPGTHNSS